MTNETSGNEKRSYRDHFLTLITDGFLVQIYLYLSHHVRSVIRHLCTSCQLTVDTGTHIHLEHWSIDYFSRAMVSQRQGRTRYMDGWRTKTLFKYIAPPLYIIMSASGGDGWIHSSRHWSNDSLCPVPWWVRDRGALEIQMASLHLYRAHEILI